MQGSHRIIFRSSHQISPSPSTISDQVKYRECLLLFYFLFYDCNSIKREINSRVHVQSIPSFLCLHNPSSRTKFGKMESQTFFTTFDESFIFLYSCVMFKTHQKEESPSIILIFSLLIHQTRKILNLIHNFITAATVPGKL